MPDATALRRSAHKLRSIARAALDQYGIVDAKLSFLAGCKQPAFRVRSLNKSIHASRDARYNENMFLLRMFPDGARAPAAIRSELQWIGGILKDTSIVVPMPVSDRDGELVFKASLPGDNDVYHCALTRWVKGRIFLRPTGPGAHLLRFVGRAMAHLHTHGQQFRRDAGFRCPRWDFEGLFGERSPYFPDVEKKVLQTSERQMYSKVARLCHAAMDQLGVGRDVFGLVHGDLIQLNYLFYKNEVRIIDFGDLGCAHYIYDMAVTLFALLDLDRDGSQRRAFIEGYREVRAFSDEHETLLNIFLATRGVLLSRFVIGNSGGKLSDQGAKYVSRVINGIRSWMSRD